MAAVATAVPEQAEAPTTIPAEEPTAVPIPEPVEAAHTEHTAVPDPTDPVEEAAPRFGLLRFRDSDTALAGSFQLLMENVPPAAGILIFLPNQTDPLFFWTISPHQSFTRYQAGGMLRRTSA